MTQMDDEDICRHRKASYALGLHRCFECGVEVYPAQGGGWTIYAPAPAPGVPPVKESHHPQCAKVLWSEPCDCWIGGGASVAGTSPETATDAELLDAVACSGIEFDDPRLDRAAKQLRGQQRPSAPAAPKELPAPPTSEPSEEEVEDGLRRIELFLGGEWPNNISEGFRLVAQLRDTLAARRASRVEMTRENAGAVLRRAVDRAYDLGILAVGDDELVSQRAKKRDEIVDDLVPLLASHRESSGPDVNATRLRTLYEALPFEQQMRFGGDFAEFCEGLDAGAQRSGQHHSADNHLNRNTDG